MKKIKNIGVLVSKGVCLGAAKENDFLLGIPDFTHPPLEIEAVYSRYDISAEFVLRSTEVDPSDISTFLQDT